MPALPARPRRVPATFPPPRTLTARDHNLPAMTSSFVGREATLPISRSRHWRRSLGDDHRRGRSGEKPASRSRPRGHCGAFREGRLARRPGRGHRSQAILEAVADASRTGQPGIPFRDSVVERLGTGPALLVSSTPRAPARRHGCRRRIPRRLPDPRRARHISRRVAIARGARNATRRPRGRGAIALFVCGRAPRVATPCSTTTTTSCARGSVACPSPSNSPPPGCARTRRGGGRRDGLARWTYLARASAICRNASGLGRDRVEHRPVADEELAAFHELAVFLGGAAPEVINAVHGSPSGPLCCVNSPHKSLVRLSSSSFDDAPAHPPVRVREARRG